MQVKSVSIAPENIPPATRGGVAMRSQGMAAARAIPDHGTSSLAGLRAREHVRHPHAFNASTARSQERLAGA
jgi:hypothetical protein